MPSTPFGLRKIVRANVAAFVEANTEPSRFTGVCLAVTHRQRCQVRFGIHDSATPFRILRALTCLIGLC